MCAIFYMGNFQLSFFYIIPQNYWFFIKIYWNSKQNFHYESQRTTRTYHFYGFCNRSNWSRLRTRAYRGLRWMHGRLSLSKMSLVSRMRSFRISPVTTKGTFFLPRFRSFTFRFEAKCTPWKIVSTTFQTIPITIPKKLSNCRIWIIKSCVLTIFFRYKKIYLRLSCWKSVSPSLGKLQPKQSVRFLKFSFLQILHSQSPSPGL